MMRGVLSRWGLFLPAILLLAGCSVPVHQQRLLARPSMQFGSSPAYADRPSILAQTEPGAGGAGGGLAAGCTSCR